MPEKRIQFPSKFQFLFRPKRYKGAHGGRGSSKSWSFARALLLLAKERPLRILCVRELQNSIKDSVHKLLADQIEDLGLASEFEIQKTSIRSKCGSEFIFAGIRMNIQKIKSMEGIDICWVEEAELISERSWEILIPTIRKDDCLIYSDEPVSSEIWITWNPNEEADPTHKRFILNPPPPDAATIAEVNWQDNPFFPTTLYKEMRNAYATDPDTAAHVWGGQCRKNGAAQIFRGKIKVVAFEPDRSKFTKWRGPYFGQDWGFSTDPNALVKTGIYGTDLYIEREWFGWGTELDDIATAILSVPDSNHYTILADNSRPETISYVSRVGKLNIKAAKKWAGSVEDGITFLKSFTNIFIHPRCVHMKDEARLYSYIVDPLTNMPTTVIEDKNNHGWDAVRYALEPMISGKSNLLDVLG